MRALSLWQPWASAIAVGAKKIETRSWWTPYRGPLAIHAAKTKNGELREFFTRGVCDPLRRAGYERFDDLPFGAIVATCRLVECLRSNDVANLTAQECALGDYSRGRYAWVLAEIRQLATPIPARGAQGFWEWRPRDRADSELFGSQREASGNAGSSPTGAT